MNIVIMFSMSCVGVFKSLFQLSVFQESIYEKCISATPLYIKKAKILFIYSLKIKV